MLFFCCYCYTKTCLAFVPHSSPFNKSTQSTSLWTRLQYIWSVIHHQGFPRPRNHCSLVNYKFSSPRKLFFPNIEWTVEMIPYLHQFAPRVKRNISRDNEQEFLNVQKCFYVHSFSTALPTKQKVLFFLHSYLFEAGSQRFQKLIHQLLDCCQTNFSGDNSLFNNNKALPALPPFTVMYTDSFKPID